MEILCVFFFFCSHLSLLQIIFFFFFEIQFFVVVFRSFIHGKISVEMTNTCTMNLLTNGPKFIRLYSGSHFSAVPCESIRTQHYYRNRCIRIDSIELFCPFWLIPFLWHENLKSIFRTENQK